MPDGTATAGLYRPKLLTAIREGYGRQKFRKDILAGLTVATVTIPLSMAIAVASGVEPARGHYAAVIGGFLTVLLSGLMLIVAGILRLGSLIHHIPHAVTVGFTCGIAATIFASQLKLRDWREAIVLLPTFMLTLLVDLTTGIIAGCGVAVLLAIMHRPVSEEDA